MFLPSGVNPILKIGDFDVGRIVENGSFRLGYKAGHWPRQPIYQSRWAGSRILHGRGTKRNDRRNGCPSSVLDVFWGYFPESLLKFRSAWPQKIGIDSRMSGILCIGITFWPRMPVYQGIMILEQPGISSSLIKEKENVPSGFMIVCNLG